MAIPAHDVATIEAFERFNDVGDIMAMQQSAENSVNDFIRGMMNE